MNFYFCESCNKRITDAELAAGSAKNKQVKGVYCSECASGVNTIQFEALDDTEAVKVISQTAQVSPARSLRPVPNRTPGRGSERSTSRVARAAGKPAESTRGAHHEQHTPSNSNVVLMAAGVGGGIGLIALVILFSGGNAKPVQAEKSNDPPKQTVRAENDKAPVAEKQISPPAIPVAERAVQKSPAPPEETQPRREAKAAASADDLSAKAFDATLKKIAALGEDKSDERKSLAEAFVKEYPESMEAARMRVKIKEWSAPKAADPAPAPAAPAVATAEPATTAAPAPEKETRILFSCTTATDEGVGPYGGGQREVAEVFGVKSMAWMADKIPDPPWHSTGMTVDISKHTPTPVKVTPNTWVRFACRLEGGTNLMLHCCVGDGLYEIHLMNQPEKKWFWATFKMSDFARNIWGGANTPPNGSEYKSMGIFAGANKVPCTLYVEKFTIGEGPLPKE